MAIVKQIIDVIFSKGVNQKTDSKQTLNANLLALKNAVFNKFGRIDKRNGYNALGLRGCQGEQLSDFTSVISQNNELLATTETNLYSYSDVNDEWIDKSLLQSASVELSQTVSNNAQQTLADTCQVNNIRMTAYADSRGGIRYAIEDITTGTFIISDALATATGDTPRCVAINNNLFLFYAEANDLKYIYVGSGDPCVQQTGTTRSDLHTDHLFDVTTIGNLGYIFYKHTTAGEGRLVQVKTDGVVDAVQTTTTTIIDCLALTSYAKISSGVVYLNLAYKETTSLIKCAIYTQSLIEEVAPKTLSSTASTDISKITLFRTISTDDQVTVLFQATDASAIITADYIGHNTLDWDGTVGSDSILIRDMGLASKLFSHNDRLYVNTLHDSALQATAFTLALNEVSTITPTSYANTTVIAKYSAGNAGTYAAVGPFLPSVNGSDGLFNTVINTKGRIRSENAVLYSLLGLSNAAIDFNSQNNYTNASLNNNLFVVGGILNTYDGSTTVEQGFHLFPEYMTSADATTGGTLGDGTYQFVAIYSWTDDAGNIHRSAPSIPVSVLLEAATGTETIDLTLKYLNATNKTSELDRSDIEVTLYATEANGTIFYKTDAYVNDISAAAFVASDVSAGAPGNELLYTTGGVLDNIAAPACDLVITHKNRLFIAGLQNKNEIRYSKITRAGEANAFNEGLSITIDSQGGPITQIASMDANLVVFKENNIYAIAGDGPSDVGVGTSFTDPQLIATDVGAIDPNSVVLCPMGLLFKSKKGIYILNRSLQTDYIGAPVEDLNSEAVVSAQLLDDANEVRFSTAGGSTIVYNYFFQNWSVFDNQASVDSVMWQNNFVFTSGDEVYKEDVTTYKDSGGNVNLQVSTGWIKLTGLAGYQRAQRATITGEYKSRHILRVSVYNDYSDILQQVVEFDTNDILSVDAGFYGDETYGDMALYGSADNGVYQFEIHLKKQKCQAIRFVIEDVIDNAEVTGDGESLSLSGISISIGSKRGLNKLRAGKQG